jgi:hypothetical protein
MLVSYEMALDGKESFEKAIRGKHIVNSYFDLTSVVDVKSDYAMSRNSGDIRFPLNQKAMMMEHGIYVHKIMPLSNKRNGLFKNTFTPQSYLKTPTGKDKKIN